MKKPTAITPKPIPRRKSLTNGIAERGSSRSKKRRQSLSVGLSGHRLSSADFKGALHPATSEEEQKRPGSDETQPTDIFFFILFKKIRNIDVKRASVGVRFILSLQWGAPHLARKKINVKNIWTPKINFLNNDMLIEQNEEPTFFPETGEVKQVRVIDEGNESKALV